VGYFIIKSNYNNTLWNTNWGSNSNPHLSDQFTYVLGQLTTSSNWLQANSPKPNQAALSGTAQIASKSSGVQGEITIGQFFPHDNIASKNYPHPKSTMEAIKKII